MTTGSNSGRARHSVRAGEVMLTNGGQRTARPTNLRMPLEIDLHPIHANSLE